MSNKQFLDMIQTALTNPVHTRGDHWGLSIATNMFFDGEGMAFHLEQTSPKTLKLYTDQTFWEWLAYATLDISCYHKEIKTIADRFGVDWDENKLELSITFKRNEMSIGQAYFCLMQAVGIIGNFRYYVWFADKP